MRKKYLSVLLSIIMVAISSICFIACGDDEKEIKEETQIPTTWYIIEYYQDGADWEKMTPQGNNIYTYTGNYFGCTIGIGPYKESEGSKYYYHWTDPKDIEGYNTLSGIENWWLHGGLKVKFTFNASTGYLIMEQVSSNEDDETIEWYIKEYVQGGADWEKMTNEGNNIYTYTGSYFSGSMGVGSSPNMDGEYYYHWTDPKDIEGYNTLSGIENWWLHGGLKVKFTFDESTAHLKMEQISSNEDDETKPNTPSGLSASASSSSISLSWNSVSGAESYKIYRSTSASGSYTFIKSTSSTYYSDSSVSSGVTYYYKVSAVNSAGESSQSSYVSARIDGTTAPNTPSGLSASASSSSISLSWNSVSGAESYKIYRSTSVSGSYTFIKSTSSTYYSDSSVSSGVTYYYKVSAVNSAGESSQSSYVSARIDGTTAPNTPSGLSASASSSSISLSWNSVSGAESYKIYRSTSVSGSYTFIKSTSSTYYSDSSVSSGVTYYYKVSAVNSAGESSQSSYVSAKISGGSTNYEPCPPTVSCSGTSSVTVSWTPATSSGCGRPTSYNVLRKSQITGQFETLVSNTTRTSYTDSQPFPGKTIYGVTAVNDYGSASGISYTSSIGISAPGYATSTKGIVVDSYNLVVYVKDLNVPQAWKSYYNLELCYSQSYSGNYTGIKSWKYNDYFAAGSDSSSKTYFMDNCFSSFAGKTLYFKIRWVFEAPYSVSEVYGEWSSPKSVSIPK